MNGPDFNSLQDAAPPESVAIHPKVRQLSGLTSLRFVAALLVVLFHYGALIPERTDNFLNAAADIGYIGVTFFFVLSGFILAYNYEHVSFSVPGKKREFFRARFARVYPLYLVSIAIALPLFIGAMLKAAPGLLKELKLSALVLTPLSLQAWVPGTALAINGPGWSISVEAFFYLCFPFLMARVLASPLRWLSLTVGYWLAVNFLMYVLWPASASLIDSVPNEAVHVALLRDFIKFFPLFRVAEFLLGIVAYAGWHRYGAKIPSLFLLLAAAGNFIILVLAAPAIPTFLIHNGLSCFVWLPLLYAGAKSHSVLLTSRLPVFLGKISFALYLLHMPCLYYWLHVNKSLFHDTLAATHVIAFALVTSLISAAIAHLVIEEPMRKLLMYRKRQQPIPVAIGLPA